VEYAELFDTTQSSQREGRPDFFYGDKTLPFESRSLAT